MVKAAMISMRRRQELYGVIWIFNGLFLALCLLSYSPKDPCLFIREGATGPIGNWMGPVGATLGGWLIALFGFSIWMLPPALLAFGAWGLMGKARPDWGNPGKMALRSAGAALLVFSVSVFLELALSRINIDGEPVRAGGIAGRGLGLLLTGLVGWAGALFLGALLTVVGLMAAVDFSPLKALRMIASGALLLRERSGDVWTRWSEARRRRKEVSQEREELEKVRTQPEIRIVIDDRNKEKPKPKAPQKPKQEKLAFLKEGVYELPSVDLLDEVSESHQVIDQESLLMNARVLENKFRDFGVNGEVVEVQPGPVVTMYEFKPGPGVKINKIANLADDLAMALSALSIRIIAPIPGKDVVGIEISNHNREMVCFREIVESDLDKTKSPLAIALGKSITGEPFSFDLRKAPHLLVAGATGAGKSVCLNAMIMSVLFRATPKEVKMLMIDPKKLELSVYEGIPHLLHKVIADPKAASLALKWAVAEMENRYGILAEQGVRHIDGYNKLAASGAKKKNKKKRELDATGQETVALDDQGEKISVSDKPKVEPPTEPMPLIMIVIDELADLMMVAPRDIEESICRLAQMARAAGIHLILATQRPSVDVITGLIKANFPSRIAFKVAVRTDSRTILDQIGAERLLGHGDMLFLPPGSSGLTRLHGSFVSDQEIRRVAEFWSEQGEPDYDEAIVKARPEDKAAVVEDMDDKYQDALRVVCQTRQASVSMLQRKLKIGYNRAARIIDQMETEGLVGPSDGVKAREVLIDPIHLEQQAG